MDAMTLTIALFGSTFGLMLIGLLTDSNTK